MSPAAFIDTNVPIYAAGGEHEYKRPCQQVIRLAARNAESFFTDAEALQEIMHRYISIRRWPLGKEVLTDFANVMQGRIETVRSGDVLVAASLAERYPGTDARDYLHAAVARRLGVNRIVSTDRGFDRIEGIVRLDPARLDEWHDAVLAG